MRNKEVVVVAKSSASAIFEPGAQIVMNFEAAPETFAEGFGRIMAENLTYRYRCIFLPKDEALPRD